MSSSSAKFRNPGIVYPGLNPPDRTCNDDKCPWHGHVKVRGKLIVGKVVKAKMKNTVSILHEYLVWVGKYKRYERRRRKIHAHCPPCIPVKEGDDVLIGETRPLAKSVAFVVLGIIKSSPQSSIPQHSTPASM
ncbi:MAG: 30S ribosomal protein S17 [Desulfurococcaceae archaeon]|nr:30S ribosomal protein S17 [Desulfurococcaceae archaeon]